MTSLQDPLITRRRVGNALVQVARPLKTQYPNRLKQNEAGHLEIQENVTRIKAHPAEHLALCRHDGDICALSAKSRKSCTFLVPVLSEVTRTP